MDRTLNKFHTSQFVKKVTKLMLLSLSLFSFFFSSCSTFCYSFFPNSLSSHSSEFSFKLLTHAMDKNCIFLICNGILVFLATSSGFFVRFSPENELNDPLVLNKFGDGKGYFRSSVETTDSLLVRELVSKEEEEEEEEGGEDSNLSVEEKEQKEQNALLITTAEGGGGGGAVHIMGEEEENELSELADAYSPETVSIGFGIEEEENGFVSAEELNKKCDEFIRRMKAEIRIGAQQQLVMT